MAIDAFAKSSERPVANQNRELVKLFVTALLNPKAVVLALAILNTNAEPLANLHNLPILWVAATVATSVWSCAGNLIQHGKARSVFQVMSSVALFGFAVYLGARG